MASTMARARWARPVPRLSPMMVPRAAGSQWGLPSPVKAGTMTTPSLRLDGAGQRLEVGRPVDEPEPVPQPLHPGPGHEDRSLDGVGQRAAAGRGPPSAPMATSPSVPRSQAKVVTRPSTGAGHVSPDVHQDEAAGAEGGLGHAPVEAGLAEEGGVLVAGHAR